MVSWVLMQLADTAFPVGGFAHSGGLEALYQAGQVTGPSELERFVADTAQQTAHGALPLVAAAYDEPEALARVDDMARATLWSHVAARASKAQGRAFLDTCTRVFGRVELSAACERLARGELQGHLAPMFGFVSRVLDFARDETLAVHLHVTVRGVLSAAVRLGIVGPFEAQSIHRRAEGELDRALRLGRTLGLEDIAQSAPLTEIFQGAQDRLYSRLFQS